MDIPKDTSLREEDLPDNLIRQMSQESLTSESQDRYQVEPTTDEASSLGSLKVKKGLSAEVLRPGSRPHQPVPSLTRIPAPPRL